MKLSMRGRLVAWAIPGVVLVGLGAFAFAWFAGQSLIRQDDELWRSHVALGQDLLNRHEHEIIQSINEYALWDGMVAYVAEAPNREFEEQNLGPWLLLSFEIDFVVVLDAQARVVYASDPTVFFRLGETYEGSPIIKLAFERPARPSLAFVALREAIQGLRRGDPVQKDLSADRTDELGQVAREFAALAADLRNSKWPRLESMVGRAISIRLEERCLASSRTTTFLF
jgi:hypothetical protein